MSIQDVAEINRALKAAHLPGASPGDTFCLPDLAILWDAFTRHLFEEMASNGSSAIVARPAGRQAQLFVEDAAGRSLGAFRDPLGIAQAMLGLGIERIEFTDGEPCGCTAASIEDTLRAALLGGYEPVPDTTQHVLAGRFVDAVTGPGLPDLPGVYHVIDPALAERETGEIELSEFRDRVRSARSANDVLNLLRTRVLPHVESYQRRPFLSALMRRARRFNEMADDPDSAIELWSEVARSSATPDEQLGAIKVMMNVAKKRANVDLPAEERDVPSAIAIYLAVLALDHSPEQNRTVVLTLMYIANRLTQVSGPRDRLDVETALTLWTLAHRHDPDPGSRDQTVRTMMDVANKLADTRSLGANVDVESAIAIWCAVHGLEVDSGEREHVRRTMMDRANDLADLDGPGSTGVGAALLLWKAVHDLQAGDPDDQLLVVKTMMAAANRRVDLEQPTAALDVDTAIRIWTAVSEISELDADRQRAIRTMMALAGRLAAGGSAATAVKSALQLWDAAYRCGASGEDRLRVIKTVLDIGSSTPPFRREAALALDGRDAGGLAPRFRDPAHAGLLYYLEDYAAVIRFVDGLRPPEPSLTALKADALRKLGRLDQALQVATQVIQEVEGDQDAGPEEWDAVVSALCCRGYCHLEKGRAGEDTLDEAIEALQRAVDVANEAGIPAQPRIFTGLGYVCRLLGREQEAERAFAQALQVDGDNRKAQEAARGG